MAAVSEIPGVKGGWWKVVVEVVQGIRWVQEGTVMCHGLQ
jgi:hypothetical protein